MIETEELEKLKSKGATCLDCQHYPCDVSEDPEYLCYGFKEM